MKKNRSMMMFLVMGGLLLGSVLAGAALTRPAQRANAAGAAQTVPGQAIEDGTNDGETADDGQEIEDGTNDGETADDGQGNVENEASDGNLIEATDARVQTALAAVTAAYPNATIRSIEMDPADGGNQIDVLLDNGLEVKVDLSGAILATEND